MCILSNIFTLLTAEIRLALSKIVKFTGEPKSADIRRHSQKAIIRLFDLNPTNLSLMLRTLPKPDQDNANKILSTYVSELPSSGDESDRDTAATPRAKKTTPTPKVCWLHMTLHSQHESITSSHYIISSPA